MLLKGSQSVTLATDSQETVSKKGENLICQARQNMQTDLY